MDEESWEHNLMHLNAQNNRTKHPSLNPLASNEGLPQQHCASSEHQEESLVFLTCPSEGCPFTTIKVKDAALVDKLVDQLSMHFKARHENKGDSEYSQNPSGSRGNSIPKRKKKDASMQKLQSSELSRKPLMMP